MLNLREIFDLEEVDDWRDPVEVAGPTLPTTTDLPDDWREYYEERAAIREYDGGQAREHAEAEALQETLRAMEIANALD